ncbi:hypothetical protein L596_013524 [Steinernema carpocapsae]|uniref:Uncharacterized protein n=1 Tax=Steinernema carpocapsae TaxID=34508 RepID=A0A4U5P0E5_STECR|nr:hypothetical protein L596_013524 [Steinernema carpocapsae]
MNEEQFHLVEDMFTHLTISKILKSDSNFTMKLSDHFADLPSEQLRSFIGCQKGCFTLVAMYEHGGLKASRCQEGGQAHPLGQIPSHGSNGPPQEVEGTVNRSVSSVLLSLLLGAGGRIVVFCC